MNCPACNREVDHLERGVCAKCRRNFAAAHKGKMKTKWLPSDFTIHDKANWHAANTEPVIMDDEDAHAADSLAAARKVLETVRTAYALALKYKGNCELAFNVMGLSLGWHDLVGCKTDVELARKLKLGPSGKATVGKCKKVFQQKIQLRPLIGQRTEAACEHMRTARIKQLLP